jgi:HD-like signal output (HDOD) protein/ActR/RegA family two-component response regulator
MQVMFVDDEYRVLSGIERAFAMRDTGWECRFCTSGEEALASLQHHPADVVASDMRMPFMDGAEFLSRVRERWPGTLRIILSGYSDPATTARMLDVAHQFVAKPCNNATLLAIVKNALSLRSLLDDQSVIELIGRVSRLPTAPKLFFELNRLVANPATSIPTIIAPIIRDPALGAKVLQLGNSAYFTRGQPVRDVAEAVRHLGLDQVRLLVLASQVFAGAEESPRVVELQTRALLASRIASQIAMQVGEQPGLAATAALLARLGLLIPGLDSPEAECARTRCELSLHATVGAYLLGLWGLPLDIVHAVALHTDPGLIATSEFGLTGVVHVAVALANDKEPDLGYLQRVDVMEQLPSWQATALSLKGDHDE